MGKIAVLTDSNSGITQEQAKDEKYYFVDSKGEYWRSYKYITDATSYDLVENPKDFYESAVAFGHFQKLSFSFYDDEKVGRECPDDTSQCSQRLSEIEGSQHDIEAQKIDKHIPYIVG